MEIAYFKRHQRGSIYHYFKVYGGNGKTKDGYQEVINFLNDIPIISIEHNQPYDPSNPDRPFNLTGTWCNYEVGTPILKEEYDLAFELAVSGQFSIR